MNFYPSITQSYRHWNENLVKKVPAALIGTSLQTIQQFFRKCMDYQNAYKLGLHGPDVGAQLKLYKSYRMPPPFERTDDLRKGSHLN